MTQVQRFMRIGFLLVLGFAFVGCGEATSVQEAPQSDDIRQYIADNPEVLLDEDLDVVDDATIE
tara:strand:+ start:597901 stop:598092 length:192 start_codon:yes stop_codon:yes gene_type:complete